MTQVLICVLMLLFSLSSQAIGKYSEFGLCSIAVKRVTTAISESLNTKLKDAHCVIQNAVVRYWPLSPAPPSASTKGATSLIHAGAEEKLTISLFGGEGGSMLISGGHKTAATPTTAATLNIVHDGEKAAVAVRGVAFGNYMRAVETLDVSTARNGAVFYPGPGNRALAESFAVANGRTTLEMTAGGRWLDSQNLFGPNSPLTPDQATAVWSRLSQRFAEGASGNAVGFVQGAHANGIFNRVEFPALQANPNVTNVLTGGF